MKIHSKTLPYKNVTPSSCSQGSITPSLSQICLCTSHVVLYHGCVLLPARRGCCRPAVLLAWRRGALVGGQSQNGSQWEWQVAPGLPDIVTVLLRCGASGPPAGSLGGRRGRLPAEAPFMAAAVRKWLGLQGFEGHGAHGVAGHWARTHRHGYGDVWGGSSECFEEGMGQASVRIYETWARVRRKRSTEREVEGRDEKDVRWKNK